MKLLISGATATLRALPGDAPVGHLVTPFTGNRLVEIARTGRMWAADNGCFNGFDRAAFLKMMEAIDNIHRPRGRHEYMRQTAWSIGDYHWSGFSPCIPCFWIVAPDVVGDAEATLDLWNEWRYTVLCVAWRGWRDVAFVAQDGMKCSWVPWEKIGCLFLGGTDAYKESEAAYQLLKAAKGHNKWVHVGRVNSERRLRLFDDVVDSIDGTQFSMFPNRYIPRWCERLKPSLRHRRQTTAITLPMFQEEVA